MSINRRNLQPPRVSFSFNSFSRICVSGGTDNSRVQIAGASISPGQKRRGQGGRAEISAAEGSFPRSFSWFPPRSRESRGICRAITLSASICLSLVVYKIVRSSPSDTLILAESSG